MTQHIVADLADQFDRYLDRLAGEIRAYPNDEALWEVAPGIANSGGTLALHIVGNLNHWIGANLGRTGYQRDREREFGDRGVARVSLLEQVAEVRATVASVLGSVDPESLGTVFPELPDRYAGSSTFWFLSHLTIHLGYHLGQVNYHRRLLCSNPAP